MNYINYIKHSLYTPDIYHRRYDFDLPRLQETVKRTMVTALPFMGLYRPFSSPISITMNSSRVFSHLQSAIAMEEKKEWLQCSAEVGKTAFAALSLAMTFVAFTPGLVITTSGDTVQAAWQTCQALCEGQYSKASEEALQTLASFAYFSFMATGSLEAMVAFALFQAAISVPSAERICRRPMHRGMRQTCNGWDSAQSSQSLYPFHS